MSDRIMANERFLDSATSVVQKSRKPSIGEVVYICRRRLGGRLIEPWRWFETEESEEDEDAGID